MNRRAFALAALAVLCFSSARAFDLSVTAEKLVPEAERTFAQDTVNMLVEERVLEVLARMSDGVRNDATQKNLAETAAVLKAEHTGPATLVGVRAEPRGAITAYHLDYEINMSTGFVKLNVVVASNGKGAMLVTGISGQRAIEDPNAPLGNPRYNRISGVLFWISVGVALATLVSLFRSSRSDKIFWAIFILVFIPGVGFAPATLSLAIRPIILPFQFSVGPGNFSGPAPFLFFSLPVGAIFYWLTRKRT